MKWWAFAAFAAAIRAGAIGYVMRSAGTEQHRYPHTGVTRFDDGLTPIPSAALALPDAEQITRLIVVLQRHQGRPFSSSFMGYR